MAIKFLHNNLNLIAKQTLIKDSLVELRNLNDLSNWAI